MQRLYLQYRPSDTSIRQLVDLQAELFAVQPRGRIVAESQLHVTLIHFGIIDEIYQVIRRSAPHLDHSDYRRYVADFVAEAEQAMPRQLTLLPDTLSLFGVASNVLVIELPVVESDTALVAAHAAALAALQTCLRRCGIDDVQGFMAADPNFRFALTLKPHISLLKNASVIPETVALPEKLQFTAMPTLYD